jgi:hypothetical protein
VEELLGFVVVGFFSLPFDVITVLLVTLCSILIKKINKEQIATKRRGFALVKCK